MQIRDFSRLVKTFVNICDFCGFLDIFLNLDQELMDFYKYLDPDLSSQPYLFTICASKLASKWAKSVGNSNFFKKSRQKSRLSQKIMESLVSIAKVSILKISTVKKKVDQHDGHSGRFSKVSLDKKDVLNWSRLSRPPGLYKRVSL
jgi:hypothetical protein